MKNKSVGIIGFGKMGELLSRIFDQKYNVGVYSLPEPKTDLKTYSSLKSLYSSSDYIVIAVPMDNINDILDKLYKLDVGKVKAIFDISTFKMNFIDSYKKFPDHIKVASVHPMFGEGVNDIKDKNIIVVQVEDRKKDARYIGDLFSPFNANISFMDVEEHDKIMKVVIGIPYFIGISYLNLISKYKDIEKFGGTSFEYLTTYGKAVLNDSPEFIEEIIDESQDMIEKLFKNVDFDKNDLEEIIDIYKDEIEDNYGRFNRSLK